jgi:hypothetical protein
VDSSNKQSTHTCLSNSAKIAGNIWKQFEQTADWTYPSTSTWIEETLEKVSAGGNLPAGKLTLPPFKRMQDFRPADGQEVFIITDSVALLGNKGKGKAPDNPHIHKYLWPLLNAHFTKLTMKSMSGCYTKDILREVESIVQTKAGGNPAAFDHVLIIMPTLNALCATAGTAIKKRNPDHLEVFRKLGETLKPMKYKMVIGPGNEKMGNQREPLVRPNGC